MTRAITTAAAGTPISTITPRSSILALSQLNKKTCNLPSPDYLVHATSSSCQHASHVSPTSAISPVSRRNVIALSIGGVILDLYADAENAWAGARRPPPPSTEEKKDPNVNGVLAKVLASKRRKEAMKEAMAKQRERGKKVAE